MNTLAEWTTNTFCAAGKLGITLNKFLLIQHSVNVNSASTPQPVVDLSMLIETDQITGTILNGPVEQHKIQSAQHG